MAGKPSISKKSDRPAGDYYPTPDYAVKALLDRERFTGRVWEPACGSGEMVEVIKSYDYDVVATDLFDRGYGEAGHDFTFAATLPKDVNAIITNPPFNLAEQFVERAIMLRPDKIAMFLRLSFIEGQKRYRRIFRSHAPTRIWAFPARVTLYPSGEKSRRDASGFMAFAWFVWELPAERRSVTELRWLEIDHE
tara:strand:+ start:1810 stop:2388 length:579 start_codon:yes stop_codon:yes gene_type:complete